MKKTVYQWASEFKQLGIAVFPVNYRNKTPKVKWEQYQKILSTENEIKRWFCGGSLHNYGVVAGWKDLVILDFDSMDRYYEWQMWVLGQPKDSSADIAANMAFTVQTARGRHVYLQIPGVGQNGHIDGLDIKRHGYVIGPGSVHPSGAIYTALDTCVIIPLIPALEAVLPADWARQLNNPPQPEVSVQYAQASQVMDPYDMASNPLNRDSDLIKQIRQRHKLQDYLQNITETGHGWFMGTCPFHDDHRPSFWVDDKRQIGNCQKCSFPKPFDVINLYAKINGISDAQAITVLAHQ